LIWLVRDDLVACSASIFACSISSGSLFFCFSKLFTSDSNACVLEFSCFYPISDFASGCDVSCTSSVSVTVTHTYDIKHLPRQIMPEPQRPPRLSTNDERQQHKHHHHQHCIAAFSGARLNLRNTFNSKTGDIDFLFSLHT
jgi:hypothetical protein